VPNATYAECCEWHSAFLHLFLSQQRPRKGENHDEGHGAGSKDVRCADETWRLWLQLRFRWGLLRLWFLAVLLAVPPLPILPVVLLHGCHSHSKGPRLARLHLHVCHSNLKFARLWLLHHSGVRGVLAREPAQLFFDTASAKLNRVVVS
jgi:hypothetical protein